MARKVAGSLSEQILNIQSFQDFGRRLERDLRKTVDNRSDATEAITGQKVKKNRGYHSGVYILPFIPIFIFMKNCHF